VGNGGVDYLAGCWGWDGEAVEVPLGYCCGGGGALDTGEDAEGPKVDKHEEHAEQPGARVDYIKVFSVGKVAAKEDAGEHSHPEPGPYYHADQGCEAYDQESWIRCEDSAGKFED